jgi:hypothetical protein
MDGVLNGTFRNCNKGLQNRGLMLWRNGWWTVSWEYRLRKDVGVKEGMRNSLLIILLHKFDSLPDNLYFAITN